MNSTDKDEGVCDMESRLRSSFSAFQEKGKEEEVEKGGEVAGLKKMGDVSWKNRDNRKRG